MYVCFSSKNNSNNTKNSVTFATFVHSVGLETTLSLFEYRIFLWEPNQISLAFLFQKCNCSTIGAFKNRGSTVFRSYFECILIRKQFKHIFDIPVPIKILILQSGSIRYLRKHYHLKPLLEKETFTCKISAFHKYVITCINPS